MEGNNNQFETPTFSSPEEEIAHLRKQVAEKEQQLSNSPEQPASREQVIADEIKTYARQKPEEVLSPDHAMKIDEIETRILNLQPGHQERIDELVGIMEEKGLRNALSFVEKMDNPHIEDDFHRFLIQYFSELGPPPGVKEGTPLFKALRMKLFEVTLLRKTEDETRSFADLIAGMEQFYLGMLSLSDDSGFSQKGRNHFTIELAESNYEEEVVFYLAVPRQRERLFEKQLLAVFPDARITEKREDYNLYCDGGVTLGSVARPADKPVLPIRTYADFESDPLSILLNAFTKIKREGEGAGVQIVISPAGETYNKEYKGIIEKLKKGISFKEATQSMGAAVAKEVGGFIKELVGGAPSKEKEEKEEEKEVDQERIELIEEKVKTPIFDTNIRLVASAKTTEESEMILHEMESAFNQYALPGSNRITFKRLKGGNLKAMLRDFTYRYFNKGVSYPLSTKELTTLLHFPVAHHAIREVKEDRAKQSSAPSNIKSEGTLLGINAYQGHEREVYFQEKDRLRHFYVIGQTGTGKTTILKNMIAQDINNGDGVCFIDPHGSDIDDILANIPEERIDDVVYFDPSNASRPMGLNLLEYDANYPEQKTFVINEMFSIFQKLYGGSPESMGPVFEQYFRNATALVVEDPATGSTLLEVSRVMSDEAFRNLKLSRCNNPIVKQFWEKIATKAGGEASLQNIVPYITSKFDVFMANDVMRPIIAQQHSAFRFREIMDGQKILLINLSKGRLGDINSNLLGLIVVGKILMAALSRVDTPEDKRHPFYLYIDEFQNVTTDSIATILSEARKYKLSLNIAHQFIAQLESSTKDAVFGNVGSMGIFRVGSEDAEFLESQLSPVFGQSDIMSLENHHAYLKMLVDGQPTDAFNIRTLAPTKEHPEVVEKLKELSFYKYGRDRAEIEQAIQERFKN